MGMPDTAVLRYDVITQALHQTPVILSRRCLHAHNAPMLSFEFASGATGIFRKSSQQSGNDALTRDSLSPLMGFLSKQRGYRLRLPPRGWHWGQGMPPASCGNVHFCYACDAAIRRRRIWRHHWTGSSASGSDNSDLWYFRFFPISHKAVCFFLNMCYTKY